MIRTTPSRARLGAVAGVALCLLVAVGAMAPASAHPFGLPETAGISLSGPDTVRVHWQAGQVDDYTALAEAIGALPQSRVSQGSVAPEVGDPFLVEQAPGRLRRYLLRHIMVTRGGVPCRGTLRPLRGLAAHGVTLDFRCNGPVRHATVIISMLDDISLYYRTIATGPGDTVKAYDAFHPSCRWSFRSGRLAS